MQSDYRSRGYSVSSGRPAATLALSYDHPTGLYANATTTGGLAHDDPVFFGLVANAGYARRVAPQVSIDGGIARTQYFRAAATGNAHYTEFYAGVFAHGLSARVHLSPDYLRHGVSTAYGEVDAMLKSFGPWRLNGHVGMLNYLSTPRYVHRSTQYDWRLGLSRQIGHLDLHAAVSGGSPDHDYYRGSVHNKTAIVVGASWIF